MDSYERQTMLRLVGRALRMADMGLFEALDPALFDGKVVWARPITATEIRAGMITAAKIVAGSGRS